MRTASTKTKRQQDQDRSEALAKLREILKPGTTVYSVLRHVSKSGMRREISLLIVDPRDGEIWCFDFLASKVLRSRIGKHGGIVAGGCGMDMGYHLVYSLGRAIWPDGTPEPHGTRNGQPDRDGGYALKHRWI